MADTANIYRVSMKESELPPSSPHICTRAAGGIVAPGSQC